MAYTTTTCETAAAISPTPNLYLNDAVSSASARKQGWLAGLAVAAVCVVASNIERAPVTRRPQLIFNIYKSPPASGESSLMPGVYEYNELGMLKFCPDWKMPQSQQAGDQLLRTAHHKVTQAVASLAASDPAFQRCLATTPNKVELSPVNFDFGRDALGQGTVRLNEDGLHMLDFGSPFDCKRANAIGIEIPSSYFLCQQTAEEAMTGIAKELAHVLANHLAESKSCKLLLDTALGAAAVAALAGGIGFWPLQLIFWGRLIGKDWMVNTWLHRQQVYEADAIAATITIASGADPHSILTSMQRAYIADATSPAKAALQLVRKQRVHWHLAKLQSLLPNSTIPQSTISDSSGLQLVTAAAAKEISSASSQVKGECRQSIVIIRDCLVEELCCLRSPYGAWTDINPHWLDRIAHVEHLLEGKTSSGDNSTSSSSEVWTEDNHSYR